MKQGFEKTFSIRVNIQVVKREIDGAREGIRTPERLHAVVYSSKIGTQLGIFETTAIPG